nr:hypothetical protein [uncultured Draconibacterium sp.]
MNNPTCWGACCMQALNNRLILKHQFTTLEGFLSGNGRRCKIPFALVFEENGVYFVETFLEKDFFEDSDFSKRFTLTGVTEKGYKIEIVDITFLQFKHDNCKAKFVCRNYIKLTETKRDLPKNDKKGTEKPIHFLEIEGFNIKFADHTDTKKYWKYGEIDILDVNFDHTTCAIFLQIDGFEENYFQLIFYKAKTGNNILIDFTQRAGYGLLTYKHFKTFRKQFLSFLSLLNGGDVHIRRELTGDYYRIDGSDSEVVYNYSFTEKSNNFTSDYIPINEHHSYSSAIFNQAFRYGLHDFYHNDLKFDLSSIVSSINSAYSTSGIHEAYSILINALEKLCTKYQISIGEFEEYLIDTNLWELSIKKKLLTVLNENKSLIHSDNDKAFDIFKSKIGDINRRKNSTVQKMYDLLQFGCIPINQNVENLITKERHSAVHKGEFGENSSEMIINYQKLDHILRDIILNIIDYRSYRKPLYEYATIDEKKKAYPKKKRETVIHFCSQSIKS